MATPPAPVRAPKLVPTPVSESTPKTDESASEPAVLEKKDESTTETKTEETKPYEGSPPSMF